MRESVRRPTAARRRSLRPRTRREPGRTSRWPAARPPRSRGARAIAAAGFPRSWSRRPETPAAPSGCACITGNKNEHQVRQLDPAHGARAAHDRALRGGAGARGERPPDRLLRHLELRLRRTLRGRARQVRSLAPEAPDLHGPLHVIAALLLDAYRDVAAPGRAPVAVDVG